MSIEADRLSREIARRKRETGALILAHVYQRPEVQDAADAVGDSLQLAREAARAAAPLVVFCGVRFMAETAKVLSPASRVVLPDPSAGCPMADMITAAELREFRARHPGVPALCYVNTSAEVKAECEWCCTSANAVDVARAIPSDEIVWVPDRWLGSWVAEQTGKRLHLWPGFCPVHQRFSVRELEALKAAHPGAETIVHPECDREIRDLADVVLGTGGMAKRVAATSATTFIIGTEVNFLHRLKRLNPAKTFIPLSPAAGCPNMAKTDLAKLLAALAPGTPEVTLDPALMDRARACLDRMVGIG